MPKKKASTKKASKYDASKITVLEGLQAVRKRPAMYIGDTDEAGLHQILKEAIDNSIDEAIGGYCNKIIVTLNKDGSVSVEDNGRGIPVDIHKQTKKSALETVMTTLHAGGKFDSESYKVSTGLHGVGISCTNALSQWMKTEVYLDGKVYSQEYTRGKPKAKVKPTGKTKKKGTKQTFLPDPQIFKKTTKFSYKKILESLRQQAYLTAGLTFILQDERPKGKNGEARTKEYTLHFEGGIKSYIRDLNEGEKTINDIFYAKGTEEGVEVETAFQFTQDLQENVLAFSNNILNTEGGTHLTGFRMALTKAINDYLQKIGNGNEKDIKLQGTDVREGLTAVTSVKVPEPQFEGQTKIKLNNPEVQGIVRTVVGKALDAYFEENPQDGKSVLARAMLANKARKAAKAAREAVVRKGALEGGMLPGKLADCSSRKPEECELCIVEGDSAGGSAKQARDRKIQAVLPMRGKPMNSEKYRIDRVLQNEKIKDFITALGAGIGETLDLKKLRYHKIILMNDADVDGEHITTLELTIIFRHLKPLIEQGYIYIAQPPLYKIEVGKKESHWLADDKAKDTLLEKLKKQGKEPNLIQRYKGLGEMNPEQLWETTMNPKNRTLRKITIEDAQEADKTFDMLMGTEVPPRKRFIQTHAQQAELDV